MALSTLRCFIMMFAYVILMAYIFCWFSTFVHDTGYVVTLFSSGGEDATMAVWPKTRSGPRGDSVLITSLFYPSSAKKQLEVKGFLGHCQWPTWLSCQSSDWLTENSATEPFVYNSLWQLSSSGLAGPVFRPHLRWVCWHVLNTPCIVFL